MNIMSTIKTQIQKQLRLRPWEFLILTLAVAYLILDIVLFKKNPHIIININIILNPLLAIIVAVVAFLLIRKMGAGNPNRPLWSGLTIGWVLWAIAEILYTIPLFTGKDATYPSAADIFWLFGYIPMFLAFMQRQRVLPVQLSLINKILSMVIALVMIGFTGYFILVPLLAAFNPNETLKSILNLLYPLLDLALLLLVLRSFFAFVQGTYGQARLWVAIGFFFKTFSDLVYCYLRGINRYYHYGLVDFPSVFLRDYCYTIGYLFFLLGLIVLWRVPMFSAPIIKTPEDSVLQ
jgi:hypothetical protein